MRLISENKYPSLISEAQSRWRTLKSNGVRSKVMARAISQVMARAISQVMAQAISQVMAQPVSQRLKPEIVAAAPVGVKES